MGALFWLDDAAIGKTHSIKCEPPNISQQKRKSSQRIIPARIKWILFSISFHSWTLSGGTSHGLCRTSRNDRTTVNKMFLNNFQSRCRLVSISFSSFLLNCKWMATPYNNHLINLNIDQIKILSSVAIVRGPRIWNGQDETLLLSTFTDLPKQYHQYCIRPVLRK